MKQHFVATVTVEYSTNIIISQKKESRFLLVWKPERLSIEHVASNTTGCYKHLVAINEIYDDLHLITLVLTRWYREGLTIIRPSFYRIKAHKA